MLLEALITRKTVTVGEKLVLPYKLAEVRIAVIGNVENFMRSFFFLRNACIFLQEKIDKQSIK